MNNTITNEKRGLTPSTPAQDSTPCEEMEKQARKLMDMSVEFRAELYKFDMMCRMCNKCMANGGKP